MKKEGCLLNVHLYRHKVQYYETDQMGIVHHANYIHWFEEARCDFLEAVGLPYAAMETEGIASPVLEISCRYKSKVLYGETVTIESTIQKYTGFRMRVAYVVRGSDGKVRCTGETEHCFVNRDGRPVTLARVKPEWHSLFLRQSEAETETAPSGEREHDPDES